MEGRPEEEQKQINKDEGFMYTLIRGEKIEVEKKRYSTVDNGALCQ